MFKICFSLQFYIDINW